DVHLLARVARVDPHAGRAVRGRELAESRERDVAATLQRVGDSFEERVDGLTGVLARESRAAGHLGNEISLRHSLLQSLIACRLERPYNLSLCRSTMRLAGRLSRSFRLLQQ